MTEPEEPSTLPNRTMENRVAFWREAMAWQISSAIRLDAPMTLVGRTALSVEIRMKARTPAFTAASASVWVPKTLLRMPSTTLPSTSGTCL